MQSRGFKLVFPASAGMILSAPSCFLPGSRVPRIRGDDPSEEQTANVYRPCSPHPRG